MDTRTTATTAQKGQQVDVRAMIDEIKTYMPETYASIQKKALELGNDAYALVRRGLRGEVGCFYAFERGRVVGTPFNEPEINAEIACYMVTFGVSHVCIWPAKKAEGTNGSN